MLPSHKSKPSCFLFSYAQVARDWELHSLFLFPSSIISFGISFYWRYIRLILLFFILIFFIRLFYHADRTLGTPFKNITSFYAQYSKYENRVTAWWILNDFDRSVLLHRDQQWENVLDILMIEKAKPVLIIH